MPRHHLQRFRQDESGAIAATYAIALIGLVAMGGVAFDYARMVTMDSELQGGADQAALAAATQLNGGADAITRATSAASGLVSNDTLMANDGNASGRAVTVASLLFFATKADAEAGTNGFTDVARSAEARYVRAAVNPRQAFYAFTPIVGAISSGNLAAAATAGLESSICKVPPVMICYPDPGNLPTSEAEVDAWIAGMVGRGIRLKASGGGGSWAPGDFGFLDVGSGAADLAKLIGWVNPPGECVAVENPTTQPGAITSVINEFNTRFDIYDGGDSINCWSGSLCPPSDNSRKDVVQKVAGGGGGGGGGGFPSKPDCGYATGAGGNGWRLTPNPYRPPSASTYSALGLANPDAMGFPRDICHAWSETGNCAAGRIGDAVWDVNAYWQVNHGGENYGSQAGANPSRYAVYQWERANPQTDPREFSSGGDTYRDYQAGSCRTGWVPGDTQVDRRVIPVAVVNCTGLNGAAQVDPVAWIDAFLVEPSLDRDSGGTIYTQKGDIYVEVVGKTGQGTGGATTQYVRRDKPFLVN